MSGTWLSFSTAGYKGKFSDAIAMALAGYVDRYGKRPHEIMVACGDGGKCGPYAVKESSQVPANTIRLGPVPERSK